MLLLSLKSKGETVIGAIRLRTLILGCAMLSLITCKYGGKSLQECKELFKWLCINILMRTGGSRGRSRCSSGGDADLVCHNVNDSLEVFDYCFFSFSM